MAFRLDCRFHQRRPEARGDGGIDLVIVSYGPAEPTARMIRSFASVDGANRARVSVVCNAATAEQEETIVTAARTVDLDVEVWSTQTNLYYWGAARALLGTPSWRDSRSPDWIVVCNHDLVFHDPGFVPTLLGRDPAREGILAPAILTGGGRRDLNPARPRRMGPVERLRWRVYFSAFWVADLLLRLDRIRKLPRALLRRTGPGSRGPGAAEKLIYAPHGACMVFSRRYFEQGGYFDCGFKLYGEEDSVAAICHSRGIPVRHFPALQVTHEEHATTGPFGRWKWERQREAYSYIQRRYPGETDSFLCLVRQLGRPVTQSRA